MESSNNTALGVRIENGVVHLDDTTVAATGLNSPFSIEGGEVWKNLLEYENELSKHGEHMMRDDLNNGQRLALSHSAAVITRRQNVMLAVADYTIHKGFKEMLGKYGN